MSLRICLGSNCGRRVVDSWSHICSSGVVFSEKISIVL